MQISKHSTVLPTVKTINSLPARPGHWTTTCATVVRWTFLLHVQVSPGGCDLPACCGRAAHKKLWPSWRMMSWWLILEPGQIFSLKSFWVESMTNGKGLLFLEGASDHPPANRAVRHWHRLHREALDAHPCRQPKSVGRTGQFSSCPLFTENNWWIREHRALVWRASDERILHPCWLNSDNTHIFARESCHCHLCILPPESFRTSVWYQGGQTAVL